jgi:hypothetical protein
MAAPPIRDEELVAFADGELEPGRAAELAQRVAADPALARQVAALRESRRLLAASLDPVAAEPVPARLLAAARGPAPTRSVRPPRWAIAASVALLVAAGAALWPSGDARLAVGPAASGLAAILASAPSGGERGLGAGTVRLVASHEAAGQLCREFALVAPGERIGGLACRSATGWQVEMLRALPPAGGAVRPASGGDPLVREALELRAAGPALSPEAERAALARTAR